jgi:hypothetical protein
VSVPRLHLLALLLGLSACGRNAAIEPSAQVAYGPLKQVILLPLTTRSAEGILGHVLREDGVTPERSRAVLGGAPLWSETSQRVTVVRELSQEARVALGYGPAKAELSEGLVTHLAYVVELTGYAEVEPTRPYRPESDCCINGAPAPQCEQGYVQRLLRGSGVIKFLKRESSQQSLKGAEYFETRLGQRFVVLDESSFTDAFFGFEAGDMWRLCATLPDEATFVTTHVTPTPNCKVRSYDIEGNTRQLGRFLPDRRACQMVAERFCAELGANPVHCSASFGGEQLTLPPLPPPPSEPVRDQPTSE